MVAYLDLITNNFIPPAILTRVSSEAKTMLFRKPVSQYARHNTEIERKKKNLRIFQTKIQTPKPTHRKVLIVILGSRTKKKNRNITR